MSALFNIRPRPDASITTKTPSTQSSPSDPLCTLCDLSQSAPYTCASCNTPYCTSRCFQSHNNGACYEEFAKKQMKKHTDLEQKDPDNQHKIGDILRRELDRSRDENPDDPPDASEAEFDELLKLAETLSTNDSDVDVDSLLSAVSPSLRSAFLFSLSQATSAWEPWWLPSRGDELPAPLPYDLDSLIIALPHLNILLPAAVTAAPFLYNNAADIVFAYTVVKRVYNGVLDATDPALVSMIYANSEVLGADKRFDESHTLETMFSRREDEAKAMSWGGFEGEQFCDDVTVIMKNRRWIIQALQELKDVLEGAEGGSKEARKRLRQTAKKVAFYQSWAKGADI